MSSSNANLKLLNSLSLECRPKLLKDFLNDDPNSNSSNGFKSYPRKSFKSIPKSSPTELLISQSRTASAIHKVINSLKFLQFATYKSPSILPRSISRRLSRRRTDRRCGIGEISGGVKVKDILRWKSFRDLVEEKSEALDCSCESVSASSSDSGCSSKRSSWCDSDFTAQDLPLCCGESMEGKKDNSVDLKEEMHFDENDQHSPVSVLNSPFLEYKTSISSFHSSLASIERRKCELMERIRELENLAELNPEQCFSSETNSSFEDHEGELEHEAFSPEEEEMAKNMLSQLKQTCFEKDFGGDLVMDFLVDELSLCRKGNNVDLACVMLIKQAKCWIDGECDEPYRWDEEGKRLAYVRDMERGGWWKNFEEDQHKELSMEIETEVLSDLLHELFLELLESR